MPELLTRRVLEQMLAAVELPLALVDAGRHHAPLCWVNEPFERLTGFAAGPLLDTHHPWLETPDALPQGLATLPVAGPSDLTLDGRRADGTRVRWRFRVTPLEGAGGQVAWWLLTSDPPAAAGGQVRRIAREDAVTGVLGREWFEPLLRHQLAGARRRERPLAMLVFEVEHFELYLQTFGPKATDNCLRLVAHGIASSMRRATDLVARIETCRFAALAEDMDTSQAEAHVARIRRAVESLCIHHPKSPAGRYVTVQGGCRVGVPGRDDTPGDWLEGVGPAASPAVSGLMAQRGSR